MIKRTVATVLLASLCGTTGFAQAVDSLRVGAINLSYVARTSKIGRSELARIEEATRKKAAELDLKAAELQKQQADLQKTSVGLSPRAAADLQRAFDKSRVALERFQQDARNEIEAMQVKFDLEFRAKLGPVIDEVSKEKGLHLVFGLEQSTMIAWWSPSVDISAEVVKRLDAGK